MSTSVDQLLSVRIRPDVLVYGVISGSLLIDLLGFDYQFLINSNPSGSSIQRCISYYSSVLNSPVGNFCIPLYITTYFGISAYRAYNHKCKYDKYQGILTVIALPVLFGHLLPSLYNIGKIGGKGYVSEFNDDNDDKKKALKACKSIAVSHCVIISVIISNAVLNILAEKA